MKETEGTKTMRETAFPKNFWLSLWLWTSDFETLKMCYVLRSSVLNYWTTTITLRL